MSLVFDFWRKVGQDANAKCGGVVHYYDEQAQDIFLNSGIKTRLTTPKDGQWNTAELSASQFVNQIHYTQLTLDHPANGTLYMAAILPNGGVDFLRYQYAADLSDIAEVTYSAQIDNPVTEISAQIENISNAFFSSDASLFIPGAKIALGVGMGDSEVYPIGVAYIDDVSHNGKSDTVPLSGRNAIGYFLKEATFGSETHFVGTFDAVGKALAALAGVKDFKTEAGVGSVTYDFKPTDTVLAGFNYMDTVIYFSSTKPMQLAELPDGTVINGTYQFISQYIPNTYYTFDVGKDIFVRKTKKSADGAYSGIYVTGKDALKKPLIPLEIPVTTFPYWNLPKKKLKHIEAPEGWIAKQDDLWWFAQQEAKKIQQVGIVEDFTSILRPDLLVGDIAEIAHDGIGTTIGYVTEVKHKLGKKGFTTEFSVASGGDQEITADGVRTIVNSQNGYNRKLRMGDIMKNMIGKQER